jgi:phenylpropionate dioxygenase-like ring-hydroxylating dioxygenase large terminal subunit
MGELFRRYWLPVVLASEVAVAGGPPRRIRVLCEDLLVLRDSDGRLGVVSAYCSHKLAPLFFGRNEKSALQCAYHGWRFDVDGRCIEIPNMPSNYDATKLKARAAIQSYPAAEAGGLVWVYMGPRSPAPALPGMEWLQVPATHVHVGRWVQQTNWAQGMEGEIDSSHISFLHREFNAQEVQGRRLVQITTRTPAGMVDTAPVLKVEEKKYGFVCGARRNMPDGRYYWRLTQWMAPMFSMIPNDAYPRTGRAWVPIDNDNVMVFTYGYHRERPFRQEELDYLDQGETFPPPLRPEAFQLLDGYVIDTFVPLASKQNDYQLSRERQATVNFSGIGAITDQDRALQEHMKSAPGIRAGRHVDRTAELLIHSDLPVLTARRMVLRLAKDLANGIEPPALEDPACFNFLSDARVCDVAEFDTYLERYQDALTGGA